MTFFLGNHLLASLFSVLHIEHCIGFYSFVCFPLMNMKFTLQQLKPIMDIEKVFLVSHCSLGPLLFSLHAG